MSGLITLMNLLDIWASWKRLEFWIQVGIAVTLIGSLLSALGLAEVHVQFIDFACIFLLASCFMLIYGNIQQSRKLAKAEEKLGIVDTQIDQATQAVYRQKNEEINRLEIEIATWKDKTAIAKRTPGRNAIVFRKTQPIKSRRIMT